MVVRTLLAIIVVSVFGTPRALAAEGRAEALESRVEKLEQQVEDLNRQLAALIARVAALEAGDETTSTGSDNMQPIYDSLKITNARVVGGPFSSGDVVTVAYDFKNMSQKDLRIPLDKSYSRPSNLIGMRQHWIERHGNESKISGISSRIAREGRRYAAGGSIIRTGPAIGAGKSLPFEQRISTDGYPAGDYTYYIEYVGIGGDTIQTTEVHFTLLGK